MQDPYAVALRMQDRVDADELKVVGAAAPYSRKFVHPALTDLGLAAMFAWSAAIIKPWAIGIRPEPVWRRGPPS
jgi:hypothetical protein